MSEADPSPPVATEERRRPGPGNLLVVVVSVVAGVVGILPFVMASYAVEQLVLAPLDLAPVDPTNNDGSAVLVIVGVLAPLAVAVSWAVLIASLVRRHRLQPAGSWLLAVVLLAAPTLVFVAGKLG